MDGAHSPAVPIRREFLAGNAAVIAGLLMGDVAKAEGLRAAPPYDYLFFQFTKGLQHIESLVKYLDDSMVSRLRDHGCDVVGAFAPWIGWSYNQAALLVRWPQGMAARARALAELRRAPGLVSIAETPLSPIARADAAAELMHGGVYIHRWFEVPAGTAEEFASLSTQGWPDYEARFGMRIFGLLKAKATNAERAMRIDRLLLLTWYQSLGEWKVTRDADRQGLFVRRAALTLNMQPAATLVAWPREVNSTVSTK